MGSSIEHGKTAKDKLVQAVNKMADAVTSTLGPGGRNVMIDTGGMDGIHITKDGVTVARSIYFRDPVENMAAQLMKSVSNGSDSSVGDGTTTSMLLAQTMINKGIVLMEETKNIHEFMLGMEYAKSIAIVELEKHKKFIDTDTAEGLDMMRNISNISSNGDKEITDALMKSFEMVGKHGIFKISESGTGETKIERKEGMMFAMGMVSPYMVNDRSEMKWIGENVDILIYGGKLDSLLKIKKIFDHKFVNGNALNPLMIIANEFTDEIINIGVENVLKNKLPLIFVKTPGFGIEQKEYLEDIAIMTGGTAIVSDKNMKLEDVKVEDLGKANRVEVTLKNFLIMGGNGDRELIEARKNELKSLEAKEKDNYYRTKYNERYAKMSNGIAIIQLGAFSEVELAEKKYRMEDALKAVKNSITNGYLPGGGIMLFYLYGKFMLVNLGSFSKSFISGFNTVTESFLAPINKLYENLGLSPNSYLTKYIVNEKEYIGYDLKTLKKVNLIDAGIIDPYMVTISALNYAVSVTKTILTTEAVIYEPEEVDPKNELGIKQ